MTNCAPGTAGVARTRFNHPAPTTPFCELLTRVTFTVCLRVTKLAVISADPRTRQHFHFWANKKARIKCYTVRQYSVVCVILSPEVGCDTRLQQVEETSLTARNSIKSLNQVFPDICSLLGYYVALSGSSGLTSGDNVSVPSSRVKKSKKTS